MGVQHPAFAPLVLVGLQVLFGHGGEGKIPTALDVRLIGTGDNCSGLLEFKNTSSWERVCASLWNRKNNELVCRQLGCGFPSHEFSKVYVSVSGTGPAITVSCPYNANALKDCKPQKSNCTQHQYVFVICNRPEKINTSPPTPSLPTPEPTGAPKLRLAEGKFTCSGIVELYKEGHWGTVESRPEDQKELARIICSKLGCRDPLNEGEELKAGGQHLPVHWTMVTPCSVDTIWECFNRTRPSLNKKPASVFCSGSQPKAMERLVDGQSPCDGNIEVFHEGKWEVLCDKSEHRQRRGEQICKELQCGNLSSSAEVKDHKVEGIYCQEGSFHLCHTFQRKTKNCFRTRIVCQDFKPVSVDVGAGTIMSILLALVLFVVFLIICGPLIYKKLVKKFSKKQQRQWIGPTGLNQNVSFHRNSTVTLRPRSEGQRAQGEENDYSHTPKKNSYLSAYPALEGAIRSSNPPDNSSDSDYDLHSARRV
ncbi:T-cell surface glycoprotein CD5 [Alligator mississippiensis]|uniref:T-cell surface glycoprotein CD5 n=1 Tax=Alligator mississippiensis TaxID=8496 RepID=UPI0009074DA8|nr:T-cell surface glycoprotein CD5 [Alligator mississippiensis]